MKRSTTYAISSLVGLLLVGLVFSAMQVRSAQERASRAAAQAEEVDGLTQQITALTDRPTIALTQIDEVQQLSGLVEQTAADCGIDISKIDTIAAQDARRVGQTPYYRLPTRINIEDAEMPQLLDLLQRLTEGHRLRIEDCRFSAPHSEVVGKTWNAEFTLAYLIYEPGQDKVSH